jgi:hypothetical protein
MGLPDTAADEIPTATALPTALATAPAAEPVSVEIPVQNDIGEIGYNAYCADRDWKSFNGDPLPKWPEVKDDIKRAWRKSGLAVVEAFERASVNIFSETEPPAKTE